MTYLNVSIEAHREGGIGPLRVVGIEVEKGVSPNPDLSLWDISNSFNNTASDRVTDFAYEISLCVPPNFTGDDTVFAALEAFGLRREELIAAILECLAQGVASRPDTSDVSGLLNS